MSSLCICLLISSECRLSWGFTWDCESHLQSFGKLLDLETAGWEQVLVKWLYFPLGLPGWTFSLVADSLLFKFGRLGVGSWDFFLLSIQKVTSSPLRWLTGEPTSSIMSVLPCSDELKTGDIIFVRLSCDPSLNDGKCWVNKLDLLEGETSRPSRSQCEKRGAGVAVLRFLIVWILFSILLQSPRTVSLTVFSVPAPWMQREVKTSVGGL